MIPGDGSEEAAADTAEAIAPIVQNLEQQFAALEAAEAEEIIVDDVAAYETVETSGGGDMEMDMTGVRPERETDHPSLHCHLSCTFLFLGLGIRLH